jgi:hypothetical protein
MALGSFAKKALSSALGISSEQIDMTQSFGEKLKKCDVNVMKNIADKVKDYDEKQLNDLLKKINDIVK